MSAVNVVPWWLTIGKRPRDLDWRSLLRLKESGDEAAQQWLRGDPCDNTRVTDLEFSD